MNRTLSAKEKREIVIGVMLAMFLASLDSTIVAPALPIIGDSLGGQAFLPWVVSAYFVTSTAATPLYGKLSDIHGRRPIVLIALGLFLLGSLACAVAPSMGALIVARALQGLGGGGLLALAQTVVADIASPVERAQYVIYITTVWATASVAGPALGGYLSQHLSWTLIFWINLPLGALAFYVCERRLRDLPQVLRNHSLDWLGGALVVGATIAIMLMLTLGGAMVAWNSRPVIGLGAAALILGGGFVLRILHAPEPLIPPSIFANRVIDKALTAMFFGMLVNVSSSVFIPLYFETALGMDPTAAGGGLIILLGATVVGANFTGLYLPRVKHYKRMAYAGVALSVLALAGMAIFAQGLGFWGMEALAALYCLGIGALFPTMTIAVQNAADVRDMGAATSTLAFVRSLGSALGVSAFGAVIFAGGAPSVDGFRIAFALMALAMAVCFGFFAAMEELPLRGPRSAAPTR